MTSTAPRPPRSLGYILVAALLANVAGCGGGGSEVDEPAATTTAQNAAPDASAAPADAAATAEVSSAASITVPPDAASIAPTLADEQASPVASAAPEAAPVSIAAATDTTEAAPVAAVATPTTAATASDPPQVSIQSLAAEATSATATATAAATAIAVGTTDILNQARPALPFAQQSWGNNQCAGYILASQKTPEAGLHGRALADGRTLRFGRVPDSSTASGYAYELAVDPGDALTASSYRCEIAFAADTQRALPRGVNFWHALAVKLPDWRMTSDEQSLAQWHAGDTSGGLLPIYALLVRGKTMRLVLRYSTADTPTRANTKTLVVWSTDSWTPGVWLNVVTQARLSTDLADAPFVKTWINSRQVLDYAGPVGYKQPAATPYAKQGVYHWVDATNPWDMQVPTRIIRMKRPVLVKDVARTYTLAHVSQLLDNE